MFVQSDPKNRLVFFCLKIFLYMRRMHSRKKWFLWLGTCLFCLKTVFTQLKYTNTWFKEQKLKKRIFLKPVIFQCIKWTFAQLWTKIPAKWMFLSKIISNKASFCFVLNWNDKRVQFERNLKFLNIYRNESYKAILFKVNAVNYRE